MAVQVANGFYESAQRFFSSLPSNPNQSARDVYERRGELAAASTSLALSLELYLKAVGMRAKAPLSRIQDLERLYQALPGEIQKFVQERYTSKCDAVRPDRPVAVELIITTTPIQPTETEMGELSNRCGSDDTVLSLLKSEKDAFQNWRYVYEADMPSGVSLIRIEYIRLAIVTQILREILENDPPNKSQERTLKK